MMIARAGWWGRIFLYRQACDLRRSFDLLAGMVREQLNQDPLSGDLFVFINKRRTMLKALYWDSDGYAIWQKRLERGRFGLPSGNNLELERLDWMHMLEGVQIGYLKRLPRYKLAKKNSI
ncbi:MAG: IS66 family insertion sequence element accessory protein TnpB [Candidatus Omnitrophica bacterium]|nr:IS66 family insertion sequence element accessory protein TnpB [Candidatus Omnitrophota bacterium]